MNDIRKLAVLILVVFVALAACQSGSKPSAAQTDNAYATIDNNKPTFTDDQVRKARNAYISLGNLDKHGRCTACTASLSRETMPGAGQEREDISMIHPTGWRSGEGWERCHLIGFQLSGLNAEKRNLITGTHHFNVEGMLPFENQVADYIYKTGNHVLYRVTPRFKGKEMVARSVEMEALSVEDGGRGVCYHVEVFNKAPDAEINYKTGETTTAGGQGIYSNDVRLYVVNTNTGRFHYPSCGSARSISERNRKEVKAKRSELIREGYEPCGNCEP